VRQAREQRFVEVAAEEGRERSRRWSATVLLDEARDKVSELRHASLARPLVALADAVEGILHALGKLDHVFGRGHLVCVQEKRAVFVNGKQYAKIKKNKTAHNPLNFPQTYD
jgi:hypothetical protein